MPFLWDLARWELPQLGHAKRAELVRIYLMVIHLVRPSI
jgi:hypothetical protein